MNTLLNQSILLGETRITELSVRYKPQAAVDDGFGLGAVLLLVVVIAIAAAVYHFVLRKPKIDNSPAGLLNEICRVHGVSGSGNRLLNEIAAAAGLKHPAVMLLGQTSFQATVEAAESKIKLDRAKKKTISMLQRQLFSASSHSI